MSFQKIIKREVKKQGLSGYALGKLTKSKVSTRMIQAYLKGDYDMVGQRLEAVCKALGLELRPKKEKGR